MNSLPTSDHHTENQVDLQSADLKAASEQAEAETKMKEDMVKLSERVAAFEHKMALIQQFKQQVYSEIQALDQPQNEKYLSEHAKPELPTTPAESVEQQTRDEASAD